MAEIREDERVCLCGRSAEIVHCPKCGVRDIYAYQTKTVVVHRYGERRSLNTFRCRNCGLIFTSDDWELGCNAPLKRPKGKHKPRVPVANEQEKKLVLEYLSQLRDSKDLS